MINKNWTQEEDQLLKLYISQGLKTEEIAHKIGRSFKGTMHRRSKLLKEEPINYIKKEDKIDTLSQNDYISMLKEIVCADYQVKRFPKYIFAPKGKSVEILNLMISDLHTGDINYFFDNEINQKIVTYNDEIRAKFEQHLLKSIVRLLNLWKHGYYFEKLRIYLLGDLIDNDRIFEGQSATVSMPAGKQIWSAVTELVDMINFLSGYFPTVEVIGVIGNHGRSIANGKAEEAVENNFEYHLYKIMQLMFQLNSKSNIIMNVPDTRFYGTENYEHKLFLSHGETIRGASTTYVEKKAKDLLLNLPTGYNLYMIGHRHSSDRLQLAPEAEMLINGCWIPKDDYAIKLYGIATQPSQWLFGSSKSRVISSICVPLDFKGV
jgi:hypothetical protein